MPDTDWVTIEAEYVGGEATYAELARAHGVHPSLVGKRAAAHDWRKKREKYREKVGEKILRKTATKKANKLASLQTSADKLAGRIATMLEDDKAFNKYLVEVGRGRGEYSTEERTFSKTDTKALRDVVAALKDLTATMRNLYGIATEQEAAQLEIARERLQLDKAKAAQATGPEIGETGVILLPDAGDAENG